MNFWRKIAWSVICILGLRYSFAGDAQEPSEDDWRNPFWRLTEKWRVKVEWHRSLIDIRLGFKRQGYWKSLVQIGGPVGQNYWNGILTFQFYILKTTIDSIPFFFPHVGLVSRFSRDHWFETGFGWNFDKGEFGMKCTFMNWEDEEKYNPGVNARDHEEGGV